MSQNNPKYKRLESLLSDAKQVDPDPNQEVEDQLTKTLKTQIPQPDVKPATPEAEVLKTRVVEPEAKPVNQQVVQPEGQAVAREESPIDHMVEPVDVQVSRPVAMTATQEAAQQVSVTSTARKTVAKFQLAFSPKEKSSAADTAEATTGRQIQLALWTAGIFTFLGVVFFIFSVYNVIILQQGHFDASDYLLTPVTILMVAAGIAAFTLIRRGRLVGGLWIVFGLAVVPPILAVLVLGNVFAIALAYIVILATVLITWVFPKSERRKAIIATAVAVLVTVGIELWNPAFRIRSTTLQVFAPYAIGLAAIGLVALVIRQTAIGSIRTKLIAAFVIMSLLSMGVASYTTIQSMRTSLTKNIGNNMRNLALAKSAEIGQTVKSEYDLVRSLSINEAVRDAALKASRESMKGPAAIDILDQQWRTADAADDNDNPLVASVLGNELSEELVHFKEKFPSHVEVFLTDRQGLNVASTDRTPNYYQGDEKWWQTAAHQGVYIGQPEYDERRQTLSVIMAAAIYAENGTDVVGVLRSTVDFSTLAASLFSGQFGQTGKTDIYLPNGQELELEAEQDGTHHLAMEDATLDLGAFFVTNQTFVELLHDDIPNLASQAPVGVPGTDMAARNISSLGWRVVARQSRAEALQSVDAQTRSNILLLLVITAIVGATAVFLARLITNPILQLKTMADKVASGELDAEVKVTTRDEVGVLAATFNNMTSQLRNLVGSLEQRVADRTHDLELASEVGRTVTRKVADMDEMLTTAAELIRSRFGLYYTQVYLTDPAGRLLLLRAGTGEVGEALLKRGHRLTIDYASLNGRAVLDKKPVIVPDTLENANFKPNPLLPKTRSEMAVPLISGERILGVLDMQSEEPGTLGEVNLPAFEALAGQLAIAIQNSELFAQTEQARAEIESQSRRLTRTGWATYMDAIHRPEQTSFVFDQNQVITLSGADVTSSSNAHALSLPLEITGEPVGAFNVELQDEAWTEDRKELVQRVARQVTQQIENLRLLETAERYRIEAEQITRRLTHEGWEAYTGSMAEGPLGYAYNLAEVVSLKDDGHQSESHAMAVPLSVRDEAIGQLTVDKVMSTEEARAIVEAVAGQLSSHIENLRLSEQNEKRAAELEQAVNRLRELDRLKSSFLANMSHELRTPLNSILGFADVMLEELDGPLTDNMQNDLGLIQKNGKHLLHLINDVLDMAKIEAGRMNLNIEKFRVHEILDEVTSITSTLASEKNISLFIESESDREVEILADRTRLRQVMINLVNNSIKFTEHGKISILAACVDEHVLIKVKDTGMGIPADKLEEVFTEFAQVDSSTTRKAGGTGLGLPISRRLIEMHGGRLWAESSGVEGEGSVFYVELPLEARLTEPAEKLEK